MGFMRDYVRKLNQVMTRGHMVIRTPQQRDSPRERLRSQIVIAIFLIVFFTACAVSIWNAFK
jgi:hypothetical protein